MSLPTLHGRKVPSLGWVRVGLSALLAWYAAPAWAAEPAADDQIIFSRDIRPLLSDNCYACHGPDAANRPTELRFDLRESALAKLESGAPAIVPGNPAGSQLYQRITSQDDSMRMPPPETGKTLTPAQQDLIKRWIEQGAAWGDHWAFEPIRRPPVPQVSGKYPVHNPIDAFIQEKLASAGLEPSPQADKETLIRRVTYDLTGLPPTIAEIDAFVADNSPDAYERLVDRLLKSPHYGEHMARHWLDAARYGDTHGLHLDNERSLWPYRDWVISAFNNNMPFDQFTIWQLAGDLLENPTLEQRIATGFNRCNVTTSEGGSIAEEYRVRYAVDRVETTGTVWLGLTLGCAACHDHKFDPISQKEFYGLFAYFANLTENPMDGNALLPPPIVRMPNEQQQKQLTDLQQQLAQAEERKKMAGDTAVTEVAWIDDDLPPGAQPSSSGSGGGWQWIAAEEQPVTCGSKAARRTSEGLGQHFFTGAREPLVIGAGDKLFAYVYLDPEAPPKQIMLQFNDGSWEHRAYWGENRINWGKDNSPSRRRLGDLPPAGQWVRLEVDPAQVGLKPGTKLNGWAFTQFDGTVLWDKAGLITNSIEQEIAQLQQRITSLQNTIPATMVMEDAANKKPTYVLIRGQYDQPDKNQPVEPGVPAALSPLPTDAPANRLGLARWLVAPEHPLTARVIVNRDWQRYFGTGIVKTAEDFGSQGEWPSHPALLDWLAAEFMESGWNVKHMQKLIVMSATYRQSARVLPSHLEKDPDNRLLARGPRFRLDAEAIRDTALAVSGLLVDRLGGKSVRPYQPAGLWEAVGYTSSNTARFTQDHGEALYRRSMYIFWKRTAPPPTMAIFDAPSREACTVRRSRTNTPMQALALMNDVQFIEAARHLAARVMGEGGTSFDDRLNYAYRLVTGRPVKPHERDICRKLYDQSLARYRDDQEAAQKLTTAGESPPATGLDTAEHAAWTVLSNLLLNLNETITRG